MPNTSGQGKPVPSVVGWVHSTETGGTVDGPGLRYVLFLSGCPLRCRYCHNPDSWHMHDGHRETSDAVVAEIASYAPFLKRAHGGVTLSGGEPLVQPAFCRAVLHGAKALGLHTALDTSGFLGSHADDALLAETDLVLLDIKAFSEETYQSLTGAPLRPTLEFAERLAAMGKPIWLRYVLVPGLTDITAEIEGLAEFAAGLGTVERVDVLPYHDMGAYKWAQLSMAYPLADTQPPTPEEAERVREIFRAQGLTTH
ncbi:Pyruvate formate-lyase activating enzyme [Caenispirillum salinarum AK4]|uniref:Pyruvate formate-lyase-activating enzyme n=1 Tax=Caenispirillum salinarum AK4 TaxID=1238182 RepID=K9GU04_9PROT|nr:pyruvate formate-lyase-activating protein [Caenispirillum salinarum]EKV29475.1 Pyruvate formate-lyase activating enzyme [Caenispirillum salinarum AK4]